MAGGIRGGADGPLASVSLAWADAGEPTNDEAWLTPRERQILAGLRVPKRAGDWRLGRWAAKQAVIRTLGIEPPDRSEVEILPTEGGTPAVGILRPERWPPVTLSLSHAGGVGFAAASLASVRLGCDVEQLSPRSDAFVSDYFTSAEAAWIRSDPGARDLRTNLLWSAKESALKALGEGLRRDTRSVAVAVGDLDTDDSAPGRWQPVRVTETRGAGRWTGLWCHARGLVWTVVADVPPALRHPPFTDRS